MNIAFFGADGEQSKALRECLPCHNLQFFPFPLTDAFAARDEAAEIEAICVFVRDRVTACVLAGMPRLRLIVTRSTGYDHIDLEAADAAGVTVCNVPNYGEYTVAEFTFAMILTLSRKMHLAYAHSKEGEFSLNGLQGMELKDKTIGIIGTGHIGLHVARIARGFRMRTLASDRAPGTTQSGLLEITYTTLDDLLARSDIVTLHTALTPETHHLINAERLKTMQRGAILINTGRGGLVDTPALLAALDCGQIRGAALDVLEDEEHLAEFGSIMLRRRPNLVLTPHIALDTQEALDRILHTMIENIRAFTARRPHNVISGPAIDDGPREFSEA